MPATMGTCYHMVAGGMKRNVRRESGNNLNPASVSSQIYPVTGGFGVLYGKLMGDM